MLKQRIEILKSGGVITQQTADFVNAVIDLIQRDYPRVDADHAAMFTTHLAMAMERIAKGEVVDGWTSSAGNRCSSLLNIPLPGNSARRCWRCAR